MFKENKYTKCYYSIINRRQIHKLNITNSENHHIIPKSIGGSNDKTNLVRLSPREHYICHLLLTKMCKLHPHEKSMWFALHCLSNGFGHKERHNSKLYEIFKLKAMKIRSEAYSGENNPFYGKTHKEESKLYGDKNPTKRPEVRDKMSKPKDCSNRHVPCSEEKKIKLSKALLGKKDSEDVKLKKKLSKQNLVWVHNKIDKPKQIHSSLLEQHIENGYSRGRGPMSLW